MSEVGIVVKVSPEIHSQLKDACQQNKRSMARVVVALIEGWLENGAPDPFGYGSQEPEAKANPEAEEESVISALQELVMHLAKEGTKQRLQLELLSRYVEECKERLSDLEANFGKPQGGAGKEGDS